MSQREKFEDEWLANSRKLNPSCGCDERGGRVYPCSYHEGAIDGIEAGMAEGIKLTTGRMLNMLVGHMDDAFNRDELIEWIRSLTPEEVLKGNGND